MQVGSSTVQEILYIFISEHESLYVSRVGAYHTLLLGLEVVLAYVVVDYYSTS